MLQFQIEFFGYKYKNTKYKYEKYKNDFSSMTRYQIEFFGYQPWVIIQKLALPLCIFFRC